MKYQHKTKRTLNIDRTEHVCPHCGRVCIGKGLKSHIKQAHFPDENWQKKGPKTGNVPWNKGLSKETSPSLQAASEKLKLVTPKPVNDETRLKLSESAKRNGFGGYQPGCGSSKKFSYVDSSGKSITLQSTYELEMAKTLDEKGIKWVRPTYLKYGSKKYFPDFYLVDYNIYIDTKNDYLAVIDAPKIQQVINENNVDIRIVRKHEIPIIENLIHQNG